MPIGRPRRQGAVTKFDPGVGLGVVRGDDGREYPFHCTQIADGSRTIDVAACVEFDVVAGRLGRWEAASIRPARTTDAST
jgi:cold shock CspA family protein